MHVVFEQRGGQTLSVDPDLWLCALDLAVTHGWCPRGMTAPPVSSPAGASGNGEEGGQWNAFAYYLPQGQEVVDEDAREIARCLGAALPGVPDDVIPMQGLDFGRSNTLALIQRAAQGQAPGAADVQAAIEILSGPPKEDARALIRFLENGAFTISPAPVKS